MTDTVLLGAQALHLAVAAVWTGSVLFFTRAVLPLGYDGDVDPAALASSLGRLVTLSRLSAVVLLLTGGHMAGSLYTATSLLESTRGHVVLAMVALWLALAGLVEAGAGRMRDGLSAGKVREPARNGRPLFLAASAVAVLLLLDAGYLAA